MHKTISEFSTRHKYHILSFILLMIIIVSCNSKSGYPGQKDKQNRPSPPAKVAQRIHNAEVTIDYSSPRVKGRELWGKLVPYDEVWRTGANEANILQINAPVKISGTLLSAGKYSLFTIPSSSSWTVILNKDWDQWGAYNYNQEQDVLRFSVEPSLTSNFYEELTFQISNQGLVSFYWGNLTFQFRLEPTE